MLSSGVTVSDRRDRNEVRWLAGRASCGIARTLRVSVGSQKIHLLATVVGRRVTEQLLPASERRRSEGALCLPRSRSAPRHFDESSEDQRSLGPRTSAAKGVRDRSRTSVVPLTSFASLPTSNPRAIFVPASCSDQNMRGTGFEPERDGPTHSLRSFVGCDSQGSNRSCSSLSSFAHARDRI